MQNNPYAAPQTRSAQDVLAVNKVLRNTYLLLGMTLAFSAMTCGIAMAANAAPLNPWVMIIGFYAILFGIHKTQNSPMGLVLTFALTGMLGYTLGPVFNMLLSIPGGDQIVMLALGIELSVWVLLIPAVLMIVTILAGGLGAIAALFHVFVRDIGHILPVVLQLAFWVTPIVYTRDMVPDSFQWIVEHHPLAPLIQIFQDTIAYGVSPSLSIVIAYSSLCCVLWLVFWVLFKNAISEVMDAL